jgi:hypothetical protein
VQKINHTTVTKPSEKRQAAVTNAFHNWICLDHFARSMHREASAIAIPRHQEPGLALPRISSLKG